MLHIQRQLSFTKYVKKDATKGPKKPSAVGVINDDENVSQEKPLSANFIVEIRMAVSSKMHHDTKSPCSKFDFPLEAT